MLQAVLTWSPDDWESFALGLLQARHGALNVHKVPAQHKGDWGIDYFCAGEVVIYQCYAVLEPVDVATRAERQKEKITADLKKLIDNSAEVGELFLGNKIKHWKLLVPRHDSKEVNLHCAKKTIEIRAQCFPHLSDAFEVGIQDIESFPGSAVSSNFSAASVLSMKVDATQEELETWATSAQSHLLENAYRKLRKRAAGARLDNAVSEAIRAFLECNAILNALRSRAPDLHDKISTALTIRARRLNVAGPTGGTNADSIFNAELDELVRMIKNAVPSLSEDNAQQIALGTASDWIMRCPLDFPPYE